MIENHWTVLKYFDVTISWENDRQTNIDTTSDNIKML